MKIKTQIPAIPNRFLDRPRILAKLNSATNYNLTLIHAPAGYGKTAVLAQWLNFIDHAFAWISLENSENDPVFFCRYFIQAIRQNIPDLDVQLPGFLLPDNHYIQNIMTELLNHLMENPKKFILVFDDYQVINNRSIHEAVYFLLEHSPANLHVVIVTQSNPPFPMGRIKAKDQLMVLDMVDLRFSLIEAALFFNVVLNLKLSDQNIADIVERTEGWPVGMQLCGLSLQENRKVDSLIPFISGTYRQITDYLISEIFLQQPTEVRHFLLDTSILIELTDSLCNEVAGIENSRDLLTYLDEQNLFIIPIGSNPMRYRYHTLFADSLLLLLKTEFPDRLHSLHESASRWYEKNGYPHQAVDHALAGSDVKRAANLIDEIYLDLIGYNEKITITKWLKKFPEEMIQQKLSLTLLDIWVHAYDKIPGSFKITQDRLEKLINEHIAFKKENSDYLPDSFKNNMPAHAALILVNAANETYQPPQTVISLAERALQLTDENDTYLFLPLSLVMAHALIKSGSYGKAFEWLGKISVDTSDSPKFNHVGVMSAYLKAWILIQQGELTRAESVCRTTIKYFVSPLEEHGRRIPAAGSLFLCLGEIAMEKNQYEPAKGFLQKAMQRLEKTSEYGLIARGRALSALFSQIFEKNHEEALRHLKQLFYLKNFRKNADLYADALRLKFIVFEAALDENIEKLEEAKAYSEKKGFHLPDIHLTIQQFHKFDRRYTTLCALIRIAILECLTMPSPEAERALKNNLPIIKQNIKILKTNNLIALEIEQCNLKALSLMALRDERGALKEIEHTLRLANLESHLHIFITEGTPMARLLKTAVSKGIYKEFISKIFDAAGKIMGDVTSKRKNFEFQALSQREYEVLGLIEKGLSDQEIADRLTIAISTVKTHIRHIYKKLNVAKRTQAISRSKELKIL